MNSNQSLTIGLSSSLVIVSLIAIAAPIGVSVNYNQQIAALNRQAKIKNTISTIQFSSKFEKLKIDNWGIKRSEFQTFLNLSSQKTKKSWIDVRNSDNENLSDAIESIGNIAFVRIGGDFRIDFEVDWNSQYKISVENVRSNKIRFLYDSIPWLKNDNYDYLIKIPKIFTARNTDDLKVILNNPENVPYINEMFQRTEKYHIEDNLIQLTPQLVVIKFFEFFFHIL